MSKETIPMVLGLVLVGATFLHLTDRALEMQKLAARKADAEKMAKVQRNEPKHLESTNTGIQSKDAP